MKLRNIRSSLRVATMGIRSAATQGFRTEDLPEEWISEIETAEVDPKYDYLDDLLTDSKP